MSFGFGGHPCPGKRFAMLEIALFVADLKRLDLTTVKNVTKANNTRNKFSAESFGVQEHPEVDVGQAGVIWRPVRPILVEYSQRH
mmetsp:Transcript_29587/g.54292  ORF Transcript_29587/g.54292 Transcript_29587/m.54292 type:complete len:85 (+) Transcript_29587:1085-1339(+)